jgi:hypothetical protein
MLGANLAIIRPQRMRAGRRTFARGAEERFSKSRQRAAENRDNPSLAVKSLFFAATLEKRGPTSGPAVV